MITSVKVFGGKGEEVETQVNAWLVTNSRNVRKMHVSSAIYVDPHSGDGQRIVTVAFEVVSERHVD